MAGFQIVESFTLYFTRNRTSGIKTKWRRGELNPRPETAQMTASTCVSCGLSSFRRPNAGTLPPEPDVQFLGLAQTSERFGPARCFGGTVSEHRRPLQTA